MTETAFTLFDTAIGRCGIGWRDAVVACVHLPEAHDAATRARLRRRLGEAAEATPAGAIADAVARIVALLDGRPSDLDPIALDLDAVPDFDRRVYDAARAVPPGATTTYGAIAARIGAGPAEARAVGQALGRNPFAIVVPCHRVLGADGRLGGFSANGGRDTKLRMLAIERAVIERPEAAGTLALFDDLPLAAAPRRL